MAGDNYYSDASGGYYSSNSNVQKDIERPIISTGDIGMTVTEGSRVGGSFRQTMQAAIRAGVKEVELATQMEGSDKAVGAEVYGKEARQELREMARANEINIASIHSPTQIGNMSGFGGQQQGFSDETRKREVDEIKKAINFAAEVGEGSAVVVHTGEYARPISEQKWAKDESGNYIFKGYEEEAEKAAVSLVDTKTGSIINQVRKDAVVPRPVWKTNNNGEYVDDEGKVVKELKDRVPVFDSSTDSFKMKEYRWEDFEEEARQRNKLKEEKLGRALSRNEKLTTEEAFFQGILESQISQSKGWALYHSKRFDEMKQNLGKLKKAKKFYDKLDENLSEEEKWKLMRPKSSMLGRYDFLPSESKPIPELIDDLIKETQTEIEYIRKSSIGSQQQAKEYEMRQKYTTSLGKYAKKQSMKSYADAGIYAMEQSNIHKSKKPVFIAPENIFPEMGYGSHPEELMELVQDARKAMVKSLTSTKIEDPAGRLDESGKPVMVNNPRYRGWGKERAEKEAKEHIKATLDVGHLGMWFKHFEPKPGETEDKRRKRFDKWYTGQVKKLEKADVLGHIHVVDSMGYGHTHLPAGQGKMPIKTALEYLKEKGFTGTMVSEGHEEGGPRQIMKVWEYLGTPVNVYGSTQPGAPTRFSDIHQAYFGKHRAPTYIFGAYSPSNDWTLWSQTPLE